MAVCSVCRDEPTVWSFNGHDIPTGENGELSLGGEC